MAGFVSDGKRIRVSTDRGEIISARRIEGKELGNFVFVCLGVAAIFAVVLYNMWGADGAVSGRSVLLSIAGMSAVVAFFAMIGLIGERSSFGDLIFFFGLSAIAFALHKGGWGEVLRDVWNWLAVVALLGVFVGRAADCFTRAIWEPLAGITMLCLVVVVASFAQSLPSLPSFIVCAVLLVGGLLGAALILGDNSEYERGRSHLGGD